MYHIQGFNWVFNQGAQTLIELQTFFSPFYTIYLVYKLFLKYNNEKRDWDIFSM